MQTLLYFLLWAGLIFLVMRFGCGAHVMGHGHGGPRPQKGGSSAGGDVRWVPPEKDVDPVCGMTVETAKAKSAVHEGRVYYFCSADCRDKFEATPTSYVKGASAPAQPKEHHHGSCH
jgi:YHS domain-containing protein